MIEIICPMAGKIMEVNMEVGKPVQEDDEIIIIEAMKMENPIFSIASGIVKEIKCKPGDKVNEGDVLAIIE